MQTTIVNSRIIPSPHATSCEMAGETVILDAISGQYFALNQVATAIWKILQTPCGVSSICAQLVAQYDVPMERCEAEVTGLLEQLAAQGLIKIEP